MQLRMTAPMDIGLELRDQGLELGQEDVFDLSTQEKAGSKRLGDNVVHLMDDDAGESDVEEGHSVDEESDTDHRLSDLEDELDGLYDAYRTRKAEQDAKFKVKEARRKNKVREEDWEGFKEGGSDDEESEGGWEKTASIKAKIGEESDDESDLEDDDNNGEGGPNKMEQTQSLPDESRRTKLLTKLDPPESKLQPSKASQIWFAQGMFKDLATDLDNIPDDNASVKEPQEKKAVKDGAVKDKSNVSRIQCYR